MPRKFSLAKLTMRFSDGGAQPPAEPAAPPATEPGPTPPPAEKADIDSLVTKAAEKAAEVAQKRMEGTFKSMLEQSGFDADAIGKITEEWKAKQQTPEQIAAEKDATIAALTGELETTRNERIAIGKGIPEDKVADYVRLASGYDGEDFAKKLDAALERFPLEKKASPAPFAPGPGTAPVLGAENEFQKRLNKYK